MKKILIIVAIFILSNAGTAYYFANNNKCTKDTTTQQTEIKEEEILDDNPITKIEQEVQACLDNGGGGTYATTCLFDGIDKLKLETNKINNEIKKLIPKEDFNHLEESQKTWESFIKQDDTMLDETLLNNCDSASMLYLMRHGETYHNYLYRARELNFVLSSLKNFPKYYD